MSDQRRYSAVRSCRKTLPKWPPCRRKFRARVKRKMVTKQRKRLRLGCVRSTRERLRLCNRAPLETAKSEIPCRHSPARRLPNQSAGKQNENRSSQSFAQWPQHRFVASSSRRCKADQSKPTGPLRRRSTKLSTVCSFASCNRVLTNSLGKVNRVR